MNRIVSLSLIMALALSASLTSAADADTFSQKGVGLSIRKPADWTYVTAAQNTDNPNLLNLGDEERRQALLKLANASLLAITKCPEPYPDLNSSFRVSFRPFGKALVSGISAVYIRINHTLEVRVGPVFPASSEMWFAPRGDYFFLIGAGRLQHSRPIQRP